MGQRTMDASRYRALLEESMEDVGALVHDNVEAQFELMRMRRRLEEMWELAGFGDPPTFEPTVKRPPLERVG